MSRKIDFMHRLFGKDSGRKCNDCQHLIRYGIGRHWYKCDYYGDCATENTKWSPTYEACGLIDSAKQNGIPVARMMTLMVNKGIEAREWAVFYNDIR